MTAKKTEPKPQVTASNQSTTSEKVPGPVPVPPNFVTVDNRHRRSDNDVLEGHFGVVIKGEHEGRVGVFDHVEEWANDGWPKRVVFVTRDAQSEVLVVNYSDIRPTGTGRSGWPSPVK